MKNKCYTKTYYQNYQLPIFLSQLMFGLDIDIVPSNFEIPSITNNDKYLTQITMGPPTEQSQATIMICC